MTLEAHIRAEDTFPSCCVRGSSVAENPLLPHICRWEVHLLFWAFWDLQQGSGPGDFLGLVLCLKGKQEGRDPVAGGGGEGLALLLSVFPSTPCCDFSPLFQVHFLTRLRSPCTAHRSPFCP